MPNYKDVETTFRRSLDFKTAELVMNVTDGYNIAEDTEIQIIDSDSTMQRTAVVEESPNG